MPNNHPQTHTSTVLCQICLTLKGAQPDFTSGPSHIYLTKNKDNTMEKGPSFQQMLLECGAGHPHAEKWIDTDLLPVLHCIIFAFLSKINYKYCDCSRSTHRGSLFRQDGGLDIRKHHSVKCIQKLRLLNGIFMTDELTREWGKLQGWSKQYT